MKPHVFLLLFICLSIYTGHAYSQFKVLGIVVNHSGKSPLEGASVFINNTSKGTITDKDGKFEITNIPFQSFELVISYVTFETIVVKISPNNINSRFRIELVKKDNSLSEIIVGPRDKDGWNKFGKLFTDLFVGTSANASECKILNPAVLQFRQNKKTNVLTVSGTDKLLIENKALGYIISYQLEGFTYDFANRVLTYVGYSSYQEIATGRQRLKQKWILNRKEAYMGSMMHFMRAFHANSTTQQGFSMREMIKLYKKDTATIVYYNEALSGRYSLIDTSKYSIQLVRPNFGFNRDPVVIMYNKKLLTPDSIRFIDNGVVYIMFANSIRITYDHELEKPEYVIQATSNFHKTSRGSKKQTSVLIMPNITPVVVEKNGMYYDPLAIYTEEYWAWEKMAESLPADYDLGK